MEIQNSGDILNFHRFGNNERNFSGDFADGGKCKVIPEIKQILWVHFSGSKDELDSLYNLCFVRQDKFIFQRIKSSKMLRKSWLSGPSQSQMSSSIFSRS